MKHQQYFTARELQVLQERAARVRHPVENTRASSAVPLVYVWLEQEIYAMPMINLVTVHQDISIVPMPCVPSFVAGVANIRGRVLPVIDLARLLKIVPASQTSPNHILVVTGDQDKEVVFRINRIGDGTTTYNINLKPLPDPFDVPYPQFIAGLLPDGTPQLNIPAILRSPVLMVKDSFETSIR
jgi:purine-binding chemotaxis protein CheW